MRLTIVAVGRGRASPEAAVYHHYASRIVWPLALEEVEERRPLPALERRAREAALIRAAVPAAARLVALDRNGTALSSEAFAVRLAKWRDSGAADVAFVIGGADGLDPGILAAAELTISYGAATWPHLLARVLLAEQIYRAQQILAGHPYHH
jgi:23S rRNA (pseudouridine1915-N3)-methyltransferase